MLRNYRRLGWTVLISGTVLLASSVAMIAHACGFQHLGRFAQSYYEVYGEHPSQTLRRS